MQRGIGDEQESVFELVPERIEEGLSRLRLIDPRAEARMEASLGSYGQLCPVVVALGPEGAYEVVDGFKRLRAARRLGLPKIKVTLLAAGCRGRKAAMVELNRKGSPLRPLEEALVVQSLYREDRLKQIEIATLLGRHKSWVSRRIQIVDCLCEEVIEHLRLGLVCISLGRELSRLPRGNQAGALATVLKYKLTTREGCRLVSMLLERPRWEQESLLSFPEPILSERCPPYPKGQLSKGTYAFVKERLVQMRRLALAVVAAMGEPAAQTWTSEQKERLGSMAGEIEKSLKEFSDRMRP
jgi:ParB/RepB/Spo0J family partition protein